MNKYVSHRLFFFAGILRGVWYMTAAPAVKYPSVRPQKL